MGEGAHAYDDACQPRRPRLGARMPPQAANLHKECVAVVPRAVTYPPGFKGSNSGRGSVNARPNAQAFATAAKENVQP